MIVSLTSIRAEKQALALAKKIQEACAGSDMHIVACALMGVIATLPVELAAQVAHTIAIQTNERDE